jgi:hypothetical protein
MQGVAAWRASFAASPEYIGMVHTLLASHASRPLGHGLPLAHPALRAVNEQFGRTGVGYRQNVSFNGEASIPIGDANGRAIPVPATYEYIQVGRRWSGERLAFLNALPLNQTVYVVPVTPENRPFDHTTLTLNGQEYVIYASRGEIPQRLGPERAFSVIRTVSAGDGSRLYDQTQPARSRPDFFALRCSEGFAQVLGLERGSYSVFGSIPAVDRLLRGNGQAIHDGLTSVGQMLISNFRDVRGGFLSE